MAKKINNLDKNITININKNYLLIGVIIFVFVISMLYLFKNNYWFNNSHHNGYGYYNSNHYNSHCGRHR